MPGSRKILETRDPNFDFGDGYLDHSLRGPLSLGDFAEERHDLSSLLTPDPTTFNSIRVPSLLRDNGSTTVQDSYATVPKNEIIQYLMIDYHFNKRSEANTFYKELIRTFGGEEFVMRAGYLRKEYGFNVVDILLLSMVPGVTWKSIYEDAANGKLARKIEVSPAFSRPSNTKVELLSTLGVNRSHIKGRNTAHLFQAGYRDSPDPRDRIEYLNNR